MKRRISVSIIEKYPDLEREWDYRKNQMSPKEISYGSGEAVWWNCKEGHNYKMSPLLRSSGVGCPVCSGHRVVSGVNDLYSLRPDLAEEWDERANSLSATSVYYKTSKQYWWTCKNKHKYIMSVRNKTSGRGCPYCSGNRVWVGYNDLATTHPMLEKEWNYALNGSLRPTMVSAGSTRTVYWKCRRGHEWQSNIYNRTAGNGCPYCAGKLPIRGETDLQSQRPDLSKEWNYELNENLRPEMVTVRSNRSVWWICKAGHTWSATINSRVRGNGCPYCSGRYAIPGKTDLFTTNPELKKEWNFVKNMDMDPTTVKRASHKKVWWVCANKHEWQAMVCSRTGGRGCPFCGKDTNENTS